MDNLNDYNQNYNGQGYDPNLNIQNNGQFPNQQNIYSQNPQPTINNNINATLPNVQQPQVYGNQYNGQGYDPNLNIQNNGQFPNQQNIYSQNPQPTINNTDTENPYTIEYLNKIAPKKQQPFWTIGKIIGAIILACALLFSMYLILFGNKSETVTENYVKIYYNLDNLQNISVKYQKKIKDSKLSAINSSVSSSLATNLAEFKSVMNKAKIQMPKINKKDQPKYYKQLESTYKKLDTTLDDAFLNATIDQVYSREYSYHLSIVKDLISYRKKHESNKQNKETLDSIESNLKTSIEQIKQFSKESK